MASVEIGQRLSFEGNLCTIRYVGEVAGTKGSWLGVEWDDPTRGKHNGRHQGHRYFSCRSTSETAASFVRPTRPADKPQAFLSALRLKYDADAASGGGQPVRAKQIVISGKVAQEIGFDKIRREQAQLSELKIVILDGVQVAFPYAPDSQEKTPSIQDICPKVTDLDVSRNLFTQFGTVVEICSELKHLRTLRVNGNRFQDVFEDEILEGAEEVFKGVKELGVEETNLEWDEMCHIASKFPSLTTFIASNNRMPALSPILQSTITSTLVSLNLEYNEFTALTDLSPLAALTSLRNLHLKGNKISTIMPPYQTVPQPRFSPSLQYLDMSYNRVTSWAFIDALPASFPGLASLRFAHNPIYDNPELDSADASVTVASTAASTDTATATTAATEEAYMFMIARLPMLKALNFSNITVDDRTSAEVFYLGRIVRQLAAVPEDAEVKVLQRHRRWKELCEEYGEPAVVRRKELDPNVLEARLVTVAFYMAGDGSGAGAKSQYGKGQSDNQKLVELVTQIPKSFDMYAVKGIAAKLFDLWPLKLRLIWETGEWDPVAGFDDEEGDSSEDEDAEAERVDRGQTQTSPEDDEKRPGRWVRREVELKDGPRQFGYCVDGLEVKIRVERK